jgi:hypothetical protein
MMLVRFLAVVITGLALVAPASHLFVLPNKIGMPADQYFAAQSIYQGWWMVGLLLPAAAIANAALAFMTNESGARAFAIAAIALIVVNLVIFTIWTQPANAATQNWTVRPENWEALRVSWEYSHAVNAGVTLLAFCAATIAALRAA